MSALKGQWAVITGAGSGIGRAVALRLAAQGVTLCLVGRRRETLDQAALDASQHGVDVYCHAADLSSLRDLKRLVKDLEAFERFDLLIHAASVVTTGRLETASVDELDEQYRVNVRAPYVLTQALLPKLKARQGQIVFINSMAALAARANWGAHAASKHALKALADSLRDEVSGEGVRVISFYVGRATSPFPKGPPDLESRAEPPEKLIPSDDVAATLLHALSLPRTTEVTDVYLKPFRKTSS